MPKDDIFRLIYSILSELYACKKQGVRVNKEDISHERFGIPYSYWLDILLEMNEKGYVRGILCRKTKCTGRVVNYDNIDITLDGIQYLEENSMMQKAKNTLKDIKDIVPGI